MIKRCAVLFGAFTILFGTVPFYNASAATEDSTKFSVDVNQAVLELTVPTNPTVIDLNPTMTNASFGTANLTVKVATNNMTGYQLTMTPTNNTEATSLIRTELIGDEQNYREIETLELTDPVSTGYTEQTFTANKWGYKITGDNYYGIDPENTTVSHPAWVTNAPTNGTNHNLTLAAKVDADTVSGAYETTLNFRAVTNSTIAKDIITFDANGGTGTMDGIEVTAGSTVTLPENQFTAPTGYRFTGWYAIWSNGNKNTGVYANKAPYTAADIGYNRNITLYAQWTNLPVCTENCDPEPDETTGAIGTTFQRAYEIAYTYMHKGMYEEQHEGQGDYALVNSWPPQNEPYKNYDVRFAMQDMTPEICASVTVLHDDYEALDIRDNKLYHITKMKDGRCWMTQNLDFFIDSTKTYTQADTDLGYNSTTGVYESASWTPIRSSVDLAHGATTPFPDYNNSFTSPYSADIGDWYQVDTYFTYSGCNILGSPTPCDENYIKQTPFASNGTHGHLGNYYNWTAAIAMNDSSEWENRAESDGLDVPTSICPRNWRLSRSQDIQYMFGKYNTTANNIMSAPLYFVRSGVIDTYVWQFYLTGNQGGYWYGTTATGTTIAPSLFFNANGVNTFFTSALMKAAGLNVRCLAR